MDEAEPDEFDHYTTAYLFGGPTRVVQVAVLLLYEQRRIRISRATRRVDTLRREEDDLGPDGDPVRAALLDEIPGAGRPLGQVMAAVAASPEMHAIAGAVREAGLMRGRRLRLRPTRTGRTIRKMIAEDVGSSGAERLAVLGTAGVEDARLREILESDDPKRPRRTRPRKHRGHIRGSGLSYSTGAEAVIEADSGDYGGGDYGGGDSGGGF